MHTTVNPLGILAISNLEERPDLTLHGVALVKHKQLEIWNYRVGRSMLVAEANQILAGQGGPLLSAQFADPEPLTGS